MALLNSEWTSLANNNTLATLRTSLFGDKSGHADDDPPPFENSYSEKFRLATFFHDGKTIWPKAFCITPDELAHAGFYYLGQNDRVSCPWCNIILRDWTHGDVAIIEHQKHSADCMFLSHPESCGNVLMNGTNAPVFPVIPDDGPKHPQFADIELRRRTFRQLKQNIQVSIDDLAESGFFYAGIGDNVRCFYCDGGIRGWSHDDDPWIEHARLFPHCEFVKNSQGGELIENIQQQSRNSQKRLDKKRNEARQHSASRMDTPTVKVILDMGYHKDVVRKVIEQHFLETGDDFERATELLDAVNAYTEYEGKRNENEEVVTSVPHTTELPVIKTGNGRAANPNNLMEEIQQMRQNKECKICLDNSVEMVFIPCGHMTACEACSARLSICPICRKAIKSRIRAYLP